MIDENARKDQTKKKEKEKKKKEIMACWKVVYFN